MDHGAHGKHITKKMQLKVQTMMHSCGIRVFFVCFFPSKVKTSHKFNN